METSFEHPASRASSPATGSSVQGRPRKASFRRLLRGLIVIILLTSGTMVSVLWWNDRPVRAIDRALDEKRFEEALRLANAFLAEFPDRSQVLELKARALVGLGRWVEAGRLFDVIGADSQPGQRAWSQTLLHEERWSEALLLLRRLNGLSPDDPDLLHELAACSAKLGYFDESIATAERMVKVPGQESRGRLMLGMLHYRRGNNRKAIEAWRPILDRNPDAGDLQVAPAEFFAALGRALLDDGKTVEARQRLERAVQLGPAAEARNSLAEACEQLGDPDRAVALWRQIVAAAPGDRTAHEGLARIALENGRADEARRWLEPLLARADLTSSTAYLMQRAELLSGDKPAAAEWGERVESLRNREKKMSAIDQSVRDSPQSFWSRAVRAHRFASEGNAREALRLAEDLLQQESTPEARAFVENLADALRNQTPLPSLDQIPYKPF